MEIRATRQLEGMVSMECPICDSDNQEDSRFCIQCGTLFSVPQITSSTPQEMDTKVQEEPSPATIPEDAIIVLQSRWAYMLHTIPLLAFFGVSLIFDFLTLGILPTLITIYIIGSRYLSFRRTAYILTDKHLVIFQGSYGPVDIPRVVMRRVRNGAKTLAGPSTAISRLHIPVISRTYQIGLERCSDLRTERRYVSGLSMNPGR